MTSVLTAQTPGTQVKTTDRNCNVLPLDNLEDSKGTAAVTREKLEPTKLGHKVPESGQMRRETGEAEPPGAT